MDRKIFMVFDDFVKINTELVEKTKLTLYRSESYEHSFKKIEEIKLSSWENSDLRALELLIGSEKNENQILGACSSSDIMRDRNAQVGFVRVRYGGDDEFAIGATLYLADDSDTAKLVNSELSKLLRKYAHKDVVMSETGTAYNGYYWTDAALKSGKNWHLFLKQGGQRERNKNPGYRPKPVLD